VGLLSDPKADGNILQKWRIHYGYTLRAMICASAKHQLIRAGREISPIQQWRITSAIGIRYMRGELSAPLTIHPKQSDFEPSSRSAERGIEHVGGELSQQRPPMADGTFVL